jgi:hypothetical protein
MPTFRLCPAVALAALAFAVPSPAQADGCLPDDPDCAAAEQYIYPDVNCSDTTLRRCAETFSATGTVYDLAHFGSRCELYVRGEKTTPYVCYGP